MNDIVRKMARAVRWGERDPELVLIAAERAVEVLLRRKQPLDEFWETGRERNLFAAEALRIRIRRRGKLTEESAAMEHEKAVEACKKEYNRLQAESIPECQKEEGDMKNQRRDVKSLSIIEEDPPEITLWLEEAASLLATEMILGMDGMAMETARLFAERVGSRERMIVFSRRLFTLVHHVPDELTYQIRVYRIFYESIGMEWSTSAAYWQGVEILLPDPVPSELTALILKALGNYHLRYVDQLLKVFLPVRLGQLGMTGESFMTLVFQSDSSELFRGVLLAEKMILQDASTDLEGVEQWWSLLQAADRDSNGNWQSLKGWFDMYYMSRRIFAAPSQASKFLDRQVPLEPMTISVHKTNSVQQETFEALFLCEGKVVLKWLDILGESNVFRFRTDEEYFPYFEKTTSCDLTMAIRNLASQGFSREEMLRIYMNTHLRSCYNIHAFLRLAFPDGDGLEMRGAEANVRKLFDPYCVAGSVEQWNGKLGFSVHNFYTGQKIVLFPMEWQRENAEYLKKMMEEKKRLHFKVISLNLSSYSLRGIPSETPKKDTEGEDAFEIFCRELEQLEREGELTTARNKKISQLPLPKKLADQQEDQLGLLIVRCCCVLGKNPVNLRYFIKMLTRLENGVIPWRHQVFRKQNTWHRLSGETNAAVQSCWEKMCSCRLSAPDLFYVYINTAFKCCISFSEMVESCYIGRKGTIDLQPMLDGHSKYYFSGLIQKVIPDRNPGKNTWRIYLQPYEFYRGDYGRNDLFCMWTENPQGYQKGLVCQFELDTYQTYNRIFTIKEIIHLQDVRRTAARQIFLSAMNRAAYMKQLSSRDLGDLQVKVPDWSNRNIGQLVWPMLNALKRRMDNITLVNRYLMLIEKSNPWKFSQEPVPDRKFWTSVIQEEQGREYCFRLMTGFIRMNDLQSVLRVYFHTVVKSFLGIDTLLEICVEVGKELGSLPLWMREYPLKVGVSESGLKPVNFLTDKALVLKNGEGGFSCAGTEWIGVFAGYDESMEVMSLTETGEPQKCQSPDESD